MRSCSARARASARSWRASARLRAASSRACCCSKRRCSRALRCSSRRKRRCSSRLAWLSASASVGAVSAAGVWLRGFALVLSCANGGTGFTRVLGELDVIGRLASAGVKVGTVEAVCGATPLGRNTSVVTFCCCCGCAILGSMLSLGPLLATATNKPPANTVIAPAPIRRRRFLFFRCSYSSKTSWFCGSGWFWGSGFMLTGLSDDAAAAWAGKLPKTSATVWNEPNTIILSFSVTCDKAAV